VLVLAPVQNIVSGSSAAIVRPTFSRDFAGEKTLDNGTGPNITFTRNSNATFFDATGTLQTAGTNVPRFDHDPATGGSSLGLLIEESRTNSITNSADLSAASWAKTNVSVTSNTDVAPDGTTSADTVEDTTTGSTDNLITAQLVGGAANSQTWTWSFFIKKTTGATNYPAARLLFSGGTAVQSHAVINTNDGTITNTGGSTLSFSALVQNAGNYWRVSCTGTNTATGNTNVAGRIHPAYNLDGTGTQDANATGSVVIWGGQLEQGAFTTSYIPTTNAAATRAADSAVVTPISSFYNQAEGTLFAHFGAIGSLNLQTVVSAVAANDSSNDSVFIFQEGGSVNGWVTGRLTGASGFTTRSRAALAYATGAGASMAVDGSIFTNGALAQTQLLTKLGIGLLATGGGNRIFNGHIRKIAYWPRRLSNTLLQQLTT